MHNLNKGLWFSQSSEQNKMKGITCANSTRINLSRLATTPPHYRGSWPGLLSRVSPQTLKSIVKGYFWDTFIRCDAQM